MRQETLDHLRKVHGFIYDAHGTDPSELADKLEEVGNSRYARELLGILIQAGLVAQERIDGEDVWQCVQTKDQIDRAEADKIFVAAFKDTKIDDAGKERGGVVAQRSRVDTPTRATHTSPDGKCRCGCDAEVGPRSSYRPGHDARHASALAKKAIALEITRAEGLEALTHSEALQTKFLGQVRHAWGEEKWAQIDKQEREREAALNKAAEAFADRPSARQLTTGRRRASKRAAAGSASK